MTLMKTKLVLRMLLIVIILEIKVSEIKVFYQIKQKTLISKHIP